MAAPKIDALALALAAKSEAQLVFRTVKEKGAKRFVRAFAAAGSLVFAAYVFVYSPPKSRLAQLDKEIARRRTLSEWGKQYKDLRSDLTEDYRRLPKEEDRTQWLSGAIMASLQSEKLVPESFRPVVENETAGLITQNSSVQFSFKFAEFYEWLQRLENARPLMHLNSFDMRKLDEPVGSNSGQFDIVTVIPKKRYD